MQVNKSVIQTTVEAHMAERERCTEIARRFCAIATPESMTEAEVEAYVKGLREGWSFATYAIIRDGNCQFEKGE